MLVQSVLYFSNRFSCLYARTLLYHFSLKALTYTLILGKIKTNGLIITSKNPLLY